MYWSLYADRPPNTESEDKYGYVLRFLTFDRSLECYLGMVGGAKEVDEIQSDWGEGEEREKGSTCGVPRLYET